MNDQPFSTNMLTLEVLDAICDRLQIRPSALIFLDHDFSSDEVAALEKQLIDNTHQQRRTHVTDLAQHLQVIKPLTDAAAQQMAGELATALIQEDRFTQTLTLA